MAACAQGVQDDNMPAENNVDLGGTGNAGGASGSSSSAGHGGSSVASAGHAGTVGAAGTAASGGGNGGTLGVSGGGGSPSTGGSSGGKGGTNSGGGGATSVGGGGATSSGGKGGTSSGGAPAGGAASGGSTGSGGSVSTGGFTVQYKAENTTAISSYVQAEFNAKNTGATTIPVGELKLRYYFTDEPRVAPNMTINFSYISTSGSNQTLDVAWLVAGLVPTKPTADSYFEFSFTSGHDLAPGEAMDFSFQMNGPDQNADKYTQTNDYSYDATKTSFANWDHVVLFHNGTVVWGATP
jgi:cellulose 1,4-beta-cellobiosidase